MFERLKDGIVDQQLMNEAAAANPSLPVMVDEETRLDRINAPGGRKFVYNYTLLNPCYNDGSATAEFINEVKNIIRSQIVENIKIESAMSWLRQNNVIFVYKYFDTKKKQVFEIEITPANYN